MAETYGWTAERILAHYGQWINFVARVKPRSLARPGPDTLNVPKQCYEFVCEFKTYDDELMRRVFGECEAISREDWLAVFYFRAEMQEYLDRLPWEPACLETNPPAHKQYEALTYVREQTGVSERDLRRWIAEGMPHTASRHGGRIAYFVQVHVAERWRDDVKHRRLVADTTKRVAGRTDKTKQRVLGNLERRTA